jgi:hypothetical protein
VCCTACVMIQKFDNRHPDGDHLLVEAFWGIKDFIKWAFVPVLCLIGPFISCFVETKIVMFAKYCSFLRNIVTYVCFVLCTVTVYRA